MWRQSRRSINNSTIMCKHFYRNIVWRSNDEFKCYEMRKQGMIVMKLLFCSPKSNFPGVKLNSATILVFRWHTGADLGGGCRGCDPPPPEMTCGFLIQLLFCKKKEKTMWFIGVEVEQETSAPPPTKILDPPLTQLSMILLFSKNLHFMP